MSPNKNTPKSRTERLVYNDGTFVHVLRVTRDKLQSLWELQSDLLQSYVEANLSFSALIMDDYCYSTMKTIFSMLPTVEGTPIAFDKLEDDYEQLARFFCSRAYREDGSYDTITPSILSSLHHFNFNGKVGELVKEDTRKKIAEQEKADLEAAIQKQIS